MSTRVIQNLIPMGNHSFAVMDTPLVKLECECVMIGHHIVSYCRNHVPAETVKEK
jgi:hypothetical protein